MPYYALNLFDLADNEDYVAYSRRSLDAVRKHGGELVALGEKAGEIGRGSDVPQRQLMILVAWPDAAAVQAFRDDPELEDLHPLRENGTENYLWWAYETPQDLGAALRPHDGG